MNSETSSQEHYYVIFCKFSICKWKLFKLPVRHENVEIKGLTQSKYFKRRIIPLAAM